MANIYVWSGAGGSGNGSSWANAFTGLPAATTRAGAAAGDVYFVAHDHDETAAITTTFWNVQLRGTANTIDKIICVDRSVAGPGFTQADLRNTAKCGNTNTGANSFSIQGFGSANGAGWIHGINFYPGINSTLGNTYILAGFRAEYTECTFRTQTTHAQGLWSISQGVKLYNCSVWFKQTTHALNWTTSSQLDWTNDASWPFYATGSAINTTALLAPTAASSLIGLFRFTGLDLSPNSGTILTVPSSGRIMFRNCKLHASAVITPAVTGINNIAEVLIINCNSSGVIRNEKHGYACAMTTELTTKRTGGASDDTTGYSWKFVSGANLSRGVPFSSLETSIWNDVVGTSRTLTVHLVVGTTELKDTEMWLEAEYLGTSGQSLVTRATDGKTSMDAGTNQASSSETWSSPPGTPQYQKLEVTFTAQVAGFVRYRIMFAKPSTTVYVCPKAVLS
jgi:hypothetical protein